MTTDQDLMIIGAGGAGFSAAQYGARGNLRTLVLEELSSGGQALLIDELENYPGSRNPSTATISPRRWRSRPASSVPSSRTPRSWR